MLYQIDVFLQDKVGTPIKRINVHTEEHTWIKDHFDAFCLATSSFFTKDMWATVTDGKTKLTYVEKVD